MKNQKEKTGGHDPNIVMLGDYLKSIGLGTTSEYVSGVGSYYYFKKGLYGDPEHVAFTEKILSDVNINLKGFQRNEKHKVFIDRTKMPNTFTDIRSLLRVMAMDLGWVGDIQGFMKEYIKPRSKGKDIVQMIQKQVTARGLAYTISSLDIYFERIGYEVTVKEGKIKVVYSERNSEIRGQQMKEETILQKTGEKRTHQVLKNALNSMNGDLRVLESSHKLFEYVRENAHDLEESLFEVELDEMLERMKAVAKRNSTVYWTPEEFFKKLGSLDPESSEFADFYNIPYGFGEKGIIREVSGGISPADAEIPSLVFRFEGVNWKGVLDGGIANKIQRGSLRPIKKDIYK